MTKYIIVDVDGVLNSMRPTAHSFSSVGLANGLEFPLNLDRRHASWLVNLAKETESELIWGTTWQEYANAQIGSQIGLPDMYSPDFGLRKFSQNVASWKARGILKYVEDNPFVWFDDDYYVRYAISGSNGHLVLVDENAGLTENEIEIARVLLLNM